MNIRRLVLALGGVCVMAFAVVAASRISRPWPFASADSEPPTFFRLKVALSHRGQPIDLDVVVGCGVRVQSRGYNGSSVEIMDMYPLTYAMPIAGGHAVLVRTLPVVDNYGLCERGATSDNGMVPSIWKPMIVWYDKADDLSHGIGYATPDAYANPHAQLEYHGVHVQAATRKEFDAFMAGAPPNLVPAYNAGWMGVLDRPRIRTKADVTPDIARHPRTAWKLGDWPVCRGVQRIKLDEKQRAMVRRFWPLDRPRIWSLSDWKAQRELKAALRLQADFGRFGYSSPAGHSYSVPVPKPDIYPTSIDYGLDRLNPQTGKNGIHHHDSLIGDGIADRGFVFCDAEAPPLLEEALTGRPPEPRRNLACSVDGVAVPTPGNACDLPGWVAFENDEYAVTAIVTFYV